MFFPDRAVLAPQHHKLPVTTTQSSKVGDLHDHWSEQHKKNGIIVIIPTKRRKLFSMSLSPRVNVVKCCSEASSPQELHASWTQGDDPAGQPLSFHQWRGAGQLLWLHQAAGDAGGGCTGPRRYDDTQTIMPAASHRATTSIHHKTDQKPVIGQGS